MKSASISRLRDPKDSPKRRSPNDLWKDGRPENHRCLSKYFFQSRAFFTKHVENTFVYKMIEKKDLSFLLPNRPYSHPRGTVPWKRSMPAHWDSGGPTKKAKTWQLFTKSQSFCCFGTTNTTTMGLTGSTEDIAVWVEHFCGQDWKVISRQNLLQLLLNSFLFFNLIAFFACSTAQENLPIGSSTLTWRTVLFFCLTFFQHVF